MGVADSRRRVKVLLPLPLAGPYDYLVPEEMDANPGDFVAAPLGRTVSVGVVWDGEPDSELPPERLKPLDGALEVPAMSQVQRRFIDWMAGYYVQPPGAVLSMALPNAAFASAVARTAYRAADSMSAAKLTPARRRVLAVASEGPARTARDLAEAAAVTPAVVTAMAKAGLLMAVALPVDLPFPSPRLERQGSTLSADQRAAADMLVDRVAAASFSTTVLDGVTGAGKTEVYFEAVAETVRRGKQALVLLPEIALTTQWLDRFRARFGVEPATWHSELGQAARRRTWHAVAGHRASVVVGARSALFLPYADLGLIVVDEEHDQAFKQEDGVSYHARDMAVVRGSLGGFPVVLSSATPSLETVVNAETGRYGRAALTMRHGVAELPRIGAIDLRRDPPPAGRWLSPVLEEAVKATLAGGEQAMLFLNRRGYAPLTLCRTCGHRMQCPNCTAWLVEHRFERRLQCHHCGYKTALPMECPACHAERSLQPCGPGVERVAEEAAKLFPGARTLIVASDTIPGPAAAAEMIRQIAEREVDLVIGTQIVAKGHHFPMLTLVGVIDADLGLSGGDLRAAERTWQLLVQVAGRAGRAERPGQVLLQSYATEQPVIAALIAGDRDAFLEREQAARRAAGMPPFGRLAALIVAGRDGEAVAQTGRALARAAPRAPEIEVLGPAPAPLAMLRGRHRHRLLLKAERGTNVSALVRAWLGKVKVPGSVRVHVDIDPYSFL
jgi:primosomal protein N' (replication factor Y) (superfamily II helicase)